MPPTYPVPAPAANPAPAASAQLLLGDASTLPLMHAALARWALPGGSPGALPSIVVDCGGFLDVYRLGLEARRHGAAPAAVLARVQVCRAFTGYQTVRALLDLRRRFPPGHRIVLLEPLHPLRDPDLPEADRPWLFRRLLEALAWFPRAGYPLVAAQRQLAGRGNEAVLGFQQTLARRLTTRWVRQGRITGAEDGQERHPLFAGDRTATDQLPGFSALPDPGRPGAL